MKRYGNAKKMSKTEAICAMGYDVKSSRGIWTKDSEDKSRVLLTLWNNQVKNGTNCLYVDVDELHPVGESKRDDLIHNPKHKARKDRLRRVLDGAAELDVVIQFGPVGAATGAIPWLPEEQFGRKWRLVKLDPATGFFRVETD